MKIYSAIFEDSYYKGMVIVAAPSIDEVPAIIENWKKYNNPASYHGNLKELRYLCKSELQYPCVLADMEYGE